MSPSAKVHPTIRILAPSTLDGQIQDFLLDREARGLSKRTVAWYGEQLAHLAAYLVAQGAGEVATVTAGHLRAFILAFGEDHNPGGVHGAFRAARAFFNWYAAEYDVPNPCAKAAAPRVPLEPLEPAPVDDLRAMLATCERRTLTGDRDKALLLFMADSGLRRAELLALAVGDLNMASGAVMVRHGKGGKARVAFVGAKTRRALLAYLRHRPGVGDAAPLWLNKRGGLLSPTSLRAILMRRAKLAGVPAPSPHAFRRLFAITALRGGMDLISLQRLLGHSSLAVVSRYLRQVEGDLQAAHAAAGVVDRLL